MERENSTRLLQDASTLISGLLPILQLFFTRLPEGITQIYQDPSYFTGVSIITLVISYVLIVAYQAKPWFIWTLPLQGKKEQKYNEYLRSLNVLSSAKAYGAGEQPTEKKVAQLLEGLNKEPVKPPYQFKADNIISICVTVICVNAVSFVAIGQMYQPARWLIIVQSINYIFLVGFFALILAVYYRISVNSRRSDEDQKLRTNRAIQLATQANCFGAIPQVKLISSFDDQGMPNNYHVWVEYESQKYEIITDYRAQRILAVIPFK